MTQDPMNDHRPHHQRESAGRIELLVVRDPDGGTDLTLFVDGVHTSDWTSVVVDDPGAGHSLSYWRESRDSNCQDVTDGFAAAVRQAYDDNENNQYIEDDL